MTLPAELGLTAFLVALLGGAASFLSPCVLPLLPAYLSFVSGLSVEDLQKGDRRVLWSTIGFVVGFSLVFTLLGAGFSFIGGLADQRTLEIVAGTLLVILGAVVAGVTIPAFMQRDMRPLLATVPRGPAGAVVVGIAFALGLDPLRRPRPRVDPDSRCVGRATPPPAPFCSWSTRWVWASRSSSQVSSSGGRCGRSPGYGAIYAPSRSCAVSSSSSTGHCSSRGSSRGCRSACPAGSSGREFRRQCRLAAPRAAVGALAQVSGRPAPRPRWAAARPGCILPSLTPSA